jgi:gamma-glutamylcysteine synthetase
MQLINSKIISINMGLEICNFQFYQVVKKMSESRKGIKYSIETKKRMSEAHEGEKQSSERIWKRAKSNTGQKRSEKTKAKIGEKSRAYWKQNKLSLCN